MQRDKTGSFTFQHQRVARRVWGLKHIKWSEHGAKTLQDPAPCPCSSSRTPLPMQFSTGCSTGDETVPSLGLGWPCSQIWALAGHLQNHGWLTREKQDARETGYKKFFKLQIPKNTLVENWVIRLQFYHLGKRKHHGKHVKIFCASPSPNDQA